jgi:hypothetical protein
MAFTLSGCAAKGGTVTFENDLNQAVTVGVVVYSGTSTTPTAASLAAGKSISKSLDEDGYYAVAGSYGTHIIQKSGELTGGEEVVIKASEF